MSEIWYVHIPHPTLRAAGLFGCSCCRALAGAGVVGVTELGIVHHRSILQFGDVAGERGREIRLVRLEAARTCISALRACPPGAALRSVSSAPVVPVGREE